MASNTQITVRATPAPMKKAITSNNQPKQKQKKQKNSLKNRSKQEKRIVRVQPALRGPTYQRDRFYLSPCSKHYLKALTDPFSMEAGLACIPDLNDVPSFKPLIIQRGTFSVGSGGVGYVLVSPSAGGNDETAIHTTGNSFAGTALSPIPTTGVSATSIPQLPYASAQISITGVQHRTVGAGLRIRYLGTELNRSGRLIPLRSNGVRTVNVVGTTPAIALSRPEIPSDPCDRQWHCVSYLPTQTPSFDSYSYTFGSGSIQASTLISGDLGFFVDGANPTNAFEYELFIHKEYITSNGSVTPQGITPSHSDAVGLSAVRDALEGVLPSGNASKYFNDAWKFIQSYVPQDMSQVLSYAGTASKLLLTM